MNAPADHIVEFRVRYGETDRMGVVYHPNYLVWCEIGRTELIRARGPSYAEMEAEGVLLAVADASLRYQRAARYDDLVRVRTRVSAVRSRMVTFGYEIVRVDADREERLATASTTLVAIDPTQRPRTIPAHIQRMLRGE